MEWRIVVGVILVINIVVGVFAYFGLRSLIKKNEDKEIEIIMPRLKVYIFLQITTMFVSILIGLIAIFMKV